MGKLTWDGVGEKAYELGVSQGVLFLYNSTSSKWEGQAWNGLTNVTESPDGGDAEDFYADNMLYASIRGIENLNGSIECYTYPEDFEKCIGHDTLAQGIRLGQQGKVPFAIAYRTEIGNDTNPEAGYKIHIVYNCTANAAEMSHDTTEDSPNLEPFSFDFDSNPVKVTGHKPTSSIVIDSTKVASGVMAKIEAAIYGVDADAEHEIAAADPYLPMPDDILTLIA